MIKKNCLIFLISISFIGSSQANTPTLHWLEGKWSGTGGDVHSSFNWTITLSYNAGDMTLKLEYPSHSCGGTLKVITMENGKATCVEDVTYGLGQCSSGLKVTIEQQIDGSIVVNYYYQGSSTLKSSAKLKRV